jgi:hypothetical protein
LELISICGDKTKQERNIHRIKVENSQTINFNCAKKLKEKETYIKLTTPSQVKITNLIVEYGKIVRKKDEIKGIILFGNASTPRKILVLARFENKTMGMTYFFKKNNIVFNAKTGFNMIFNRNFSVVAAPCDSDVPCIKGYYYPNFDGKPNLASKDFISIIKGLGLSYNDVFLDILREKNELMVYKWNLFADPLSRNSIVTKISSEASFYMPPLNPKLKEIQKSDLQLSHQKTAIIFPTPAHNINTKAILKKYLIEIKMYTYLPSEPYKKTNITIVYHIDAKLMPKYVRGKSHFKMSNLSRITNIYNPDFKIKGSLNNLNTHILKKFDLIDTTKNYPKINSFLWEIRYKNTQDLLWNEGGKVNCWNK